jgi:hypothetical protein
MTAVIQTRAQRRMLELQAALADWHEMNTDTQWARVSCDEYLVTLSYGVIHSNGFEECALGSRLYVAKEGWIVVVPSTHGG